MRVFKLKSAFSLNLAVILFFTASGFMFDLMLCYIIAFVFFTILPACSLRGWVDGGVVMICACVLTTWPGAASPISPISSIPLILFSSIYTTPPHPLIYTIHPIPQYFLYYKKAIFYILLYYIYKKYAIDI